jgi:hypothetical protein
MNKIMKYIINFLIIIFCFNYCNLTSQNKVDSTKNDNIIDTTKNAIFGIDTAYYKLPKPDGNFITKKISFYNKGNAKLIIDRVQGSCFCASSTILNSKVNPEDTGKIMLYINLSTFSEQQHIVQFQVISNAENSPYTISVDVNYSN